MLGGCSTLCWGEHLGWFEASCSLGENAPVVSSFLDLSMELHPPPHLPQSTFASLVVAAHFYQGLGFALIGAVMHLQIFSHPMTGMVGTLLHSFISPCCYTCSLCLLFFLECWLQCMPGSPHYKFINLCPLVFSSSCGR